MATDHEINEKLQIDILIAITMISGFMSVAGGIVIIYTYRTMPSIRNSTRTLLLFLTIADIGTAVGYIAGATRYSVVYNQYLNRTSIPTDVPCQIQSFVSSFASTSSFMWTSLIAVNLFSCLILNTDLYKCSKLSTSTFHIIGWVIPGGVLIGAASSNVLGEDPTHASGPWCWINENLSKYDKVAWMFATIKGWEIATYLLTTVLYILLKFFTYRKRRVDKGIKWNYINAGLREEDEIFCIAWMVLYLVRMWGTVAFFITISTDDTGELHYLPYQILQCFHCYGDCAQATWNCILYCFCDRTVRRHICRCRQSPEKVPLLDPSHYE